MSDRGDGHLPLVPSRLPPRQRAAILLVDDDESGRYATGRLLRSQGFEVWEAATGASTLEQAGERPDLIILDVGLPDVSGFELCRRLKALQVTAHTPILYLSARYPSTADRIRGLESGADAYLSLPVDEGELLATVRSLLRSWWAGRALAESEARFKAVLDGSPHGFALMQAAREPGGRIADFLFVYVNPAGAPVLRHPVASLPGRSLREVLPRGAGRELLEAFARVVESGAPAELVTPVDTEGPTRWYRVTVSPVEDGVGATFEEVTAAREAQAERERLVAELSQFAYVVSHDLKAPLRAIANYASFLEEDLSGRVEGETRLYLERLRNRVERLQAMIEAVLEYSRAGREQAGPEPIDLAALVGEIVELLDPPPTVAVEVAPPGARLVAERAPLEQVLRNLVDNAVKHARRPDVRVTVELREGPGAYQVEVRDDGPGIPAEALDRIWGLFHTLEGEEGPGGTGIGLAVVRKLVEARGGRAWVDSVPGEGSTFRFTWPRRGGVPPEPTTGRV